MERDALSRISREWVSLWCPSPRRSRFDALHADEFADHSSAGRAPTKEAFWHGLMDLVTAFPDLDSRVDDLVIDESTCRVAVRWSARGTNRARYLGKGPTHQVVHITGIEIIEIHGGRITDRWGEWDISDFMGAPGPTD